MGETGFAARDQSETWKADRSKEDKKGGEKNQVVKQSEGKNCCRGSRGGSAGSWKSRCISKAHLKHDFTTSLKQVRAAAQVAMAM